MTRNEALALGRKLGGQAIKHKPAPTCCPRCGKQLNGRSWHSYLGHLGLHGLADRYRLWRGDLEAAQTRLRQTAWLARTRCPALGVAHFQIISL